MSTTNAFGIKDFEVGETMVDDEKGNWRVFEISTYPPPIPPEIKKQGGKALSDWLSNQKTLWKERDDQLIPLIKAVLDEHGGQMCGRLAVRTSTAAASIIGKIEGVSGVHIYIYDDRLPGPGY